MKIDYLRSFSVILGHEMEIKIYGHAGKPALVFPTQAGRFYDYEGFGMVEVCRHLIEEGKVQFFTVDSLDNQTWSNWNFPIEQRARRHNEYDHYITQEVLPFIREKNPSSEKILTTGCGLGGYHAANIFFRHPEEFDALITLSGLFSLKMFIGEYMDDNVYFNSPLVYLPNLTDPWFLDKFRQSQIILCAGQGTWEDRALEDAYALKNILDAKEIPCWLDIWGNDVNHDWFWWRKMIQYFLESYFSKDRS